MKISIVRKAKLENIRSASGVEVVDGIIYILSDDASCLYKIKHDLTLLEKVELYKSSSGATEQIPKAEKADLECMGQLSINGYKHLLLLGSGSKSPMRDKGFLIKLPTNYNRKHLVWEINVSSLYNLLRSHDEISAEGDINLEGLAFGEENVYLFNRGNRSGSYNVALSFNKPEFIEYIQGHTDATPFPSVQKIELPEIKGVPAAFTGADFFDQRYWFTCAAEDSPNAYDDGPIAGSMIGYMNIAEDYNGRFMEQRLSVKVLATAMEEGKEFSGKIESISVYEKDRENTYTAVAVTDSDGGESELLLLDIQL
ncbi:MAG TPA: hypothetical protein VNB90_08280 [Cytophagaceae bacterium]|jgi:hypothetical protein|nr:hypothetical protein [Cytophagaceae bacterium]